MLEHKPVPNSEWFTIEELKERWLVLFPKSFNQKDIDSFITHLIKSQYLKARYAIIPLNEHLGISSVFVKPKQEILGKSINEYESGYLLVTQETNTFFDSDHENYPLELDAAITAWRAVAISGQGKGSTPKLKLINWLENSSFPLNKTQRKRIATVCNFHKGAGRPENKDN